MSSRKPILLLTGTEDCVRPGHRERVAVYEHRMTLTDRHYWTERKVVHNAAPRAGDEEANIDRIKHHDGTESTVIRILGRWFPDDRDYAQLMLQVYDHRPDTMFASLRHWTGERKTLSNTIFVMDDRSLQRWRNLVTLLKMQPNGRLEKLTL